MSASKISSVLVVGGSIAGTASAIALARAGIEVTIVEPRAAVPDSGFGVCLPDAVLREAIARGYVDPQLRSIAMAERLWLTARGEARQARPLWTQRFPAPVHALRWGHLWEALRARLPDGIGFGPRAVSAVESRADAVAVQFTDGTRTEHPVVIGADGVDSAVRRSVFGSWRPRPADYVCWRGVTSTDSSALGPLLRGQGVTVGFDGGHLIAYPIPSRLDPVLATWVLYAAGGADGFERALAQLPAAWAEVLEGSHSAPRTIGDAVLDRAVEGGVLLVGDAATVTRPHTASGAAKALQDAFALEDALGAHSTWEHAAAAFDAERTPAGNALVELGRRLGRDQVEETPSWTTMTAGDLETWAAATLAGGSNYLYRTAGE